MIKVNRVERHAVDDDDVVVVVVVVVFVLFCFASCLNPINVYVLKNHKMS